MSVCIVVISEQGDDIEGWTGEVSMPGIEVRDVSRHWIASIVTVVLVFQRVYVIVSSESFSSVETRAILPMFPKYAIGFSFQIIIVDFFQTAILVRKKLHVVHVCYSTDRDETHW